MSLAWLRPMPAGVAGARRRAQVQLPLKLPRFWPFSSANLDPVQQVAGALADRRLGLRDRQLQQGFRQSPEEEQQDLQNDLKPQNIRDLLVALGQAKDPRVKAQLLDQLDRLKTLGQQFLSPKPQMPLAPQPGSMQSVPYDPADVTAQPQMERGVYTTPGGRQPPPQLPFPRGTY